MLYYLTFNCEPTNFLPFALRALTNRRSEEALDLSGTFQYPLRRHTARETAPLNITLSIREPHRTAMIDTAASMAAYSE